MSLRCLTTSTVGTMGYGDDFISGIVQKLYRELVTQAVQLLFFCICIISGCGRELFFTFHVAVPAMNPVMFFVLDIAVA